MLNIHFDGYLPLDVVFLHDTAKAVFASEMPNKSIELSITFCDQEQMRTYNRDFRGKNSNTDILTFVSNPNLEMGIKEMQDILICDILIDIIQVDKQKGSNTFKQELLQVFIHGLLHVCGYDHIRSEARNLMEDKEKMYYNSLSQSPLRYESDGSLEDIYQENTIDGR